MKIPPAVLLILSFAIVIVIGAVLLSMPFSVNGERISFLDALFTATSATCVTGLIVIDTGTRFTLFGQIVILTLIQIGGLGIITFSTFFAIMMGRKVTLSQRDIILTSVGQTNRIDTHTIVRRIIVYAASIEMIGAFFLFLAWKNRFGAGKSLYYSIFHSISAFCNAGFSTFTDNLISFRGDILTNVMVMGLIVLGGIGFLVIIDIENFIRFRRPISLHTRLVLYATIILIIASASLFFFFENSNSLKGMPYKEKMLVSLFQSVTPRTAGFNTVDIGMLSNSTLFMIIALMFIGGSPGGTAGGIKTTTASVLFMLAKSRLMGRIYTEMRSRTIPERVIGGAVAVFVLGVVILSVASFLLQATELGYTPHRESPESFFDLNFEAVSAFGTVGLSTGVTSSLTWGGKIIIILLMFIGRLGPLTIAFVVSRRKDVRTFKYAEEGIIIG
ncbi:MAG: TrkH family potassium uptake protein [Acidobacteriota bacterium]